ncbi:MAG: hypothetical protein WB810_06410 [Candidatus Cybelea sp.]
MKIWRAAAYPWSARLVAMLPTWMPHARIHLDLSDEVERLLLGMSARSVDRLLRWHRTDLKRRIYGRTKPGTLLKHQGLKVAPLIFLTFALKQPRTIACWRALKVAERHTSGELR